MAVEEKVLHDPPQPVQRVVPLQVRGVTEAYGGDDRWQVTLKAADTGQSKDNVTVSLVVLGQAPRINDIYTLALVPGVVEVRTLAVPPGSLAVLDGE